MAEQQQVTLDDGTVCDVVHPSKVKGRPRYWVHTGYESKWAPEGADRLHMHDLSSNYDPDRWLALVEAVEPVKVAGASFPTDRQARKEMPVARGVLDYFPLALLEVAKVSFKANQQHNPGEPMHWARGKSTDHADCIARHLMERGTVDKDDGLRHAAKLAWRALALLQTELELAQGYDAEAAAKVTK